MEIESDTFGQSLLASSREVGGQVVTMDKTIREGHGQFVVGRTLPASSSFSVDESW